MNRRKRSAMSALARWRRSRSHGTPVLMGSTAAEYWRAWPGRIQHERQLEGSR